MNIILWYAVALLSVSKLNVKHKSSVAWRDQNTLTRFLFTSIAPIALVGFAISDIVKK